jgi:hypothetical protein
MITAASEFQRDHRREAAESRPQEFWVAAEALVDAPRSVFCDRLNALLADAGFDPVVERSVRC